MVLWRLCCDPLLSVKVLLTLWKKVLLLFCSRKRSEEATWTHFGRRVFFSTMKHMMLSFHDPKTRNVVWWFASVQSGMMLQKLESGICNWKFTIVLVLAKMESESGNHRHEMRKMLECYSKLARVSVIRTIHISLMGSNVCHSEFSRYQKWFKLIEKSSACKDYTDTNYSYKLRWFVFLNKNPSITSGFILHNCML